MFQGVVAQTVSHTLAGTSDHVFVAVPGVDSDRAWNFATRQIGKPYDYLSLAGLFFRRDWHVDDAWQCAELVTAALIEGGVRPLRVEHMNRIVPQLLLMSPLIGQ